MKKKSKKIIILLSILLVVLTIGIGGYTYAKYRSSVRGDGQIDVARWSFKVNENSRQMETFHLVDLLDSTKLVDGKIAPGTQGAFVFRIDARTSEVGIDYEINFENEQNKPTNIVFDYDGKEYKSLADINDELKGSIFASEARQTREIQIGWKWEYETGYTEEEIAYNDIIDTEDGISDLDYTFDVVVTGTQMPPKALN